MRARDSVPQSTIQSALALVLREDEIKCCRGSSAINIKAIVAESKERHDLEGVLALAFKRSRAINTIYITTQETAPVYRDAVSEGGDLHL